MFERATSLKRSCLHFPFLDVHEMWNGLWSLLFCQVHEVHVNITAFLQVHVTACDLVLQARSPVKKWGLVGILFVSCCSGIQ